MDLSFAASVTVWVVSLLTQGDTIVGVIISALALVASPAASLGVSSLGLGDAGGEITETSTLASGSMGIAFHNPCNLQGRRCIQLGLYPEMSSWSRRRNLLPFTFNWVLSCQASLSRLNALGLASTLLSGLLLLSR